jgi:hypothetical protein
MSKKSLQVLAAICGGGLILSTGSVFLPHSVSNAQTTAANPNASSVAAANCPFLNQGRDKDTGSTTATYNSSTKVLNIAVNRTVPDMFWGVAESRTRHRADQILANCPEIAMVEVNFKSGQKLTRRRGTN